MCRRPAGVRSAPSGPLRAGGARPRTAAAARAAAMNSRSLPGSLTPGDASTPLAHVDAPRVQVGDGRAHVLGSQSSRHDQPAWDRPPLRPAASRTARPNPGWPRRSAGSGPRTREPLDVAVTGREGLDGPAGPGPAIHWVSSMDSTPCSWTPPRPIWLAMSTTRWRGLVAEDPDGHDLVGQPLHDVGHGRRGPSAGARGRRRSRPPTPPCPRPAGRRPPVVIPQILTNDRPALVGLVAAAEHRRRHRPDPEQLGHRGPPVVRADQVSPTSTAR